MFEFDLQRFADEETANAENENKPEEQSIPEELSGLPEEYAREVLEQSKTENKPQPESTPQEETPEEPAREEEKPETEESVPYARFKEKVDEANQLKVQLAEYQRRTQQQQTQVQQQFQPSQFRITPEISAKINAAIKAEAMALSGMSDDDIASLEYADADDPRISQWKQAESIAQNRVYNAIQQTQLAQQQQAQQFYKNHMAAIKIYNDFAEKEFAEPDFQEIQKFATNEYFEQLPPNEQQIIASAYLRIERQTASPAEMMCVKNYYERAKTAYRTRGAKKNAVKQSAPTLPRSDQLKGTSGSTNKELSSYDIEKLLEGDFTKLDPKTQKMLWGMT